MFAGILLAPYPHEDVDGGISNKNFIPTTFQHIILVAHNFVLSISGSHVAQWLKCLTRNPGVLGSSLTGISGFFRGSVLGQDTSEPSLVLVKPRKA